MRTRIMGAFLAIVMLLGLASAVPAFAATEETTPRILSFHNEFDTLEASANYRLLRAGRY